MTAKANLKLKGQAASPEVVFGKAFVYQNRKESLFDKRSIGRHEIEKELGQVERAVPEIGRRLGHPVPSAPRGDA
ncbi:MAG: hypothetical protein WC076_10720 [Terrimicrobiaceae bacterium]|jgi:phosphoenolpyruvate-protein kinase (PTS system EI component)|nr:hypothetical protein [Terrimicrobiaceae bacterium]